MSTPPASAVEKDLNSDIGSVRESVKWILTALAAVGAAMIGGIQFSDIGMRSGWPFTFGLSGIAVALGGVGLAIGHASSVLVIRIVSVTALSKDNEATTFLDDNPDTYGLDFESFNDFMEKRKAAWNMPSGNDDNGRNRDIAHFEAIATRIAQIWRYEKVCRRFEKARRWIFVGAALATIGTAIFATTRSGTNALPTAEPQAVRVGYRLSETGYEWLVGRASRRCAKRDGNGVLLDGWPAGSDLLIWNPSAGCEPVRVRWSDKLGTLQTAAH